MTGRARSSWAISLKAALGMMAAMVGAMALVVSAHADPIADFYAGRTISVMVGFGPGGGYDFYARVLARHLGAHVPGHPTVVVQNVP
jgi:tripartite-type tricarboxylate transporter receptor subunit TctC